MKTAVKQPKVRLTRALMAVVFAFSTLVSSFAYTAGNANAVFDYLLVRFDNIEVSTATTGTVCARTATVATEAQVRVTFPAGYTLGAFGTFTVSTSNLAWPTVPSSATAWPGITAPSGAGDITGQTVTFGSGDLTINTLYCFNWTNSAAVQTQGSASSTNTGSVATYTSGPSLIESTSYTTQTVTDDDIVVTATVPQTFSFALSANTDALGTQSTGSVDESSTPRTVTINTNAQHGWMVWAREDSNAGLFSATANHSIDSTAGTGATLSAGTEGYTTGFSDSQGGGSGTITVTSAFDYDTGTDGAGLDNTLRTVAASNGTASNAVLTIYNRLAISALTPAATDYTDTITLTGAAYF